MNKKKIIILISLVVAAVLAIVVLTEFYPVAFVNWRPIAAKSFETDYSSARIYYQKALETYDRNQAVVLDSLEIQKELKRAVLDKLIENVLIEEELEKRLKNDDVEKMVAEKIKEAIKEKDIKKEVETLYGLSLEEFKERFLKPQAKSEIFASRLLLENKNFDEELKKIKKEAKAAIFLPGFKWNGERVIMK
jgi:hypothetical protein